MVASVKIEYTNMPMIMTALREVRSRTYPVGMPAMARPRVKIVASNPPTFRL